MPVKVRFVALATFAVLALAAGPASAVQDMTSFRLLLDAKQAKPEAGLPAERIAAVWRRLAVCETGGNWQHNDPPYQGGLGFHEGSWDAYRPAQFPAEAHQASAADQVTVGKRILADVGWGAWPGCSLMLGLR
jgi:Transglycosylase-like domain